MKIATILLKHYLIGVIIALVLIGFIHLYSYIAEPYFSYAGWENILLVAAFSGIPFGISIWIFKNLKTTK
jgi:hypothetical protein